MKAEFSKTWNTSKQPRKQRKYRHNAPLHIGRKYLAAHLSKHLRKEYGRRSAKLRTEDLVKIMRGEYAGKEGKIQKMDVSKSVIFIEGVSDKRSGGKEFNVPIQASNLQIVELNLKDELRVNTLKKIKKSARVKAEKPAKEIKPKTEKKPVVEEKK